MQNRYVVVKFNHWKSGEKGIENNTKFDVIKDESEIEYSLLSGLLRQNCICGSGWCGSGSVNVQFDNNLATSVISVRV